MFWIGGSGGTGRDIFSGILPEFPKIAPSISKPKTKQGNRDSNYAEIMEGTPNRHKGKRKVPYIGFFLMVYEIFQDLSGGMSSCQLGNELARK